jgi:hypothetical protein
MGVAYQLDGSVICTGNGDPNRTATYAGPKNGTTQLSSVATFFAGDPPVVSTVTLDYVLANMPVPASSSPPGVADAGTVGNTPLVFAQSNHSHASKARKQRVTGVNTATYTWTYPVAFGAGVIPICSGTAEDPANSSLDSYNIQVVGTPTNTSCVFRIIRTTLALGILGFNATPGTINLHLLALEP